MCTPANAGTGVNPVFLYMYILDVGHLNKPLAFYINIVYNKDVPKGTERKETNMKKTYLHIGITYYNSYKVDIKPEVHYYLNDGVNPAISTFNELTVDEANKLMWKLVKLGAKNTFKLNWFNSAICTREVTFLGQL